MEQVKRQVNKLIVEITKHGQGKIQINVGPYGPDKTSILVEAGLTYRFIIDRSIFDNLIDD